MFIFCYARGAEEQCIHHFWWKGFLHLMQMEVHMCSANQSVLFIFQRLTGHQQVYMKQAIMSTAAVSFSAMLC